MIRPQAARRAAVLKAAWRAAVLQAARRAAVLSPCCSTATAMCGKVGSEIQI